MEIYLNKKQELSSVRTKPFRLEKDIQNLVESNLQTLFKLDLVKSEFSINNYRLDSLCFDIESKSFVIIEYKKDKNYSVIDQGFSYLSTVLENKGDLIIEYQEKFGKRVRKDSIDWSQIRIVFISPSFSQYQKDSINFKDLPIELYEIQQYENDLVTLNKIQSKSSSTSINDLSDGGVIGKVKREIKVYTEESITNYGSDFTKELYSQYKNKIMELGDDINVKFTQRYIGFKRGKKNFTDITVSKDFIKIWLNQKKGKIDDSKNLCRDVSNIGHWGNGDYELRVTDNKDFEYILSLIRQSYENC
ncbi:hypothetical protein HOM13_01095 [Candidatus Woesearchaeota archaeon]|jgi:predicted transport protein|nr:hypothetical protein [Candidatus Woesearchaeota archaeon]